MKGFLQSVVARREAEQEQAITEARASTLIAQDCRVCGNRVSQIDGQPQLTVCGNCGGRKVQERLELADQVEAAKRKKQSNLLAIAGIHTEETMADPKLCTACNKPLHWKAKHDTHPGCRPGAQPKETAAPARREASGDVRKQFRNLTTALGFDPDNLIDAFCRGWIANLKAKVAAQLPDDADDYQLPGDRTEQPDA